MAGRGPAPKPPEDRRNTTKPQRGDWVDVPPLDKPVLKPLPKRAKGTGVWSARTRKVFEGWRADPVTALFGDAELAAVVELAYLQEEVSRGKLSLAAEVRQRADGLALTLKGKRDLRFRLVEAKAGEEQEPRRSPRVTKRRAHLTAVK